jgi:hypothetical protein
MKLPRTGGDGTVTGEGGTVTGEDDIMAGEEPIFYSFELYVFIVFNFLASNVELCFYFS